MNRKLIAGSLLPLIVTVQSAAASDVDFETQRQKFLAAEQQINATNHPTFPANLDDLKDYPLYPVLKYQWLRNHLEQGREVQRFIENYGYTRYAASLKKAWLNHLAESKQWSRYLRFYEKTGDNTMQCQYYWALYQTGQRQQALLAAKKLWTVGYSQPKACDPLLTRLMRSRFFSNDLIWRRFAKALNNGKLGLAGYVQRLLPQQDQATAELWLKVHKNPERVADERLWRTPFRWRGEIFAHGIDRLARSDLDRAIALWDKGKNRYRVSASIAARIERRLGLALAFRKDPAAFNRLEKVPTPDKTVREWRVRAALLEGDWQHVERAVAELGAGEAGRARWRYWQARAWAETGQKSRSEKAFKQLAADRSLFGFLAAARVRQSPQLGDRPIEYEPSEMARFQQLPGIKMVAEFKALDRVNDARRQWWFQLGQFDKQHILLAAKLAQQWGWTQTAVFTVAKAEHWDDVDLRFPVDYADAVKKYSRKQELDPAIVFGLIRRESVFDQFARSPAGARGLMQIMPKTGRQIARSLREKWRSVRSLFDPAVNVKYGTYYYKQLLDRYGGHFALAAAAYNAGPARVDRWLPERAPMPADIWIETIPYKETREYVSAVLGYAMIYQQRMQRNALTVKELMRDIRPNEN